MLLRYEACVPITANCRPLCLQATRFDARIMQPCSFVEDAKKDGNLSHDLLPRALTRVGLDGDAETTPLWRRVPDRTQTSPQTGSLGAPLGSDPGQPHPRWIRPQLCNALTSGPAVSLQYNAPHSQHLLTTQAVGPIALHKLDRIWSLRASQCQNRTTKPLAATHQQYAAPQPHPPPRPHHAYHTQDGWRCRHTPTVAAPLRSITSAAGRAGSSS